MDRKWIKCAHFNSIFFQPKQRTSIVSAFEFHRLNHSHDYCEVNSSIGYASFTSSPPISPANFSIGSIEGSIEDNDIPGKKKLHINHSVWADIIFVTVFVD